MDRPVTWGIVTTVKAPVRAILDFVAHHVGLGAHRLIIHLDEDCPEARQALDRVPQCTAIVTDAAYWGRRKRPEAHQGRQSHNATRAYRRNPGVDWLAHIDVDEFLWPTRPLAEQLQALPADCTVARARPIEALSSEGTDLPLGTTCFKAMTVHRATRDDQTGAIYPTYGGHMNGGFLSHVAGKIFIRTGLDDVVVKIHNAIIAGIQNPGQQDLPDTELCHLHAPSLSDWLSRFRYRHEKGSYRPELSPTRSRESGGLTMHELFTFILDTEGDAGLVAFYDEVCRATSALRARLDAHGLLRCHRLDLDAKRAKHFPDLA